MASNPRIASHQPVSLTTESAKTLHTVTGLEQKQFIEPRDVSGLHEVADRFAIAITPQMADLIDPTDPADPIARQFVPTTAELTTLQEELNDPIGDETHSPVKGVVHRYPDRLLLTPVRVCPVYCRFCFRREHVGNNAGHALSTEELGAALNYIRSHTEVWEVILSGGDPLLLSPRRMQNIIAALNDIKHVKVIRIHTRVPAVSPARINNELIHALSTDKALYVVLHSNHVGEITPEAIDACSQLIDNGIPMLSQTVLLRGINDSVEALEQLLRKLVEIRVKPYYLHHADRARGTSHFRTSIASGRALMRELRGRVSGLCQPDYVLDIPGGAGKVPIGPDWIAGDTVGSYRVRDYQGGEHQYTDTDSSTLE